MERQTPSYDSLPTYQPDFNSCYHQWITSVNATDDLGLLTDEIDGVRKELKITENELRKLEEASSSLFNALRSRKNPLSSIIASRAERQQESERREHAKKEFEQIFSEKVKHASSVEALKARLNQMNQSQQALSFNASRSNELWLKLCETAEARLLTMEGPLATVTEERLEKLNSSETLLEAIAKLISSLTRARRCVQHAHHYYSLALRVTDELKPSTPGSRLAEGFAGDLANMSRQNEYRDAISQANKAQVCLDEFFRVTEPYFYILPQDKAAVYNSLKKDGVKQVAVICDLLYNGSSVTTSVRRSVQTLVEKQESVFESLTCLAVHIQELVPKYEQNERNARASRDELRKQLADIWKGEQPTLSTITT